MRMLNGHVIEGDIVEVLGAETWQPTIPGGKVTDATSDGIPRQAERELCEEIGYRPGGLEKLLDFYSHPSWVYGS